jgi:hypothetical protein
MEYCANQALGDIYGTHGDLLGVSHTRTRLRGCALQLMMLAAPQMEKMRLLSRTNFQFGFFVLRSKVDDSYMIHESANVHLLP